MGDVIVCRSTRFGAGCGHPVADHDGDWSRGCCCCNRRHNDSEHRADCLECHLRPLRARGLSAAEAAEELPTRFRRAFWRRQVERYLASRDRKQETCEWYTHTEDDPEGTRDG